MPRTLCIAACLLGLLSGCGAEVANTAATAAKSQALQVEQAKAQEEQFKKKLGEALQAAETAASRPAGQ
jgi:flagellar basal body L-ring protein FlgH